MCLCGMMCVCVCDVRVRVCWLVNFFVLPFWVGHAVAIHNYGETLVHFNEDTIRGEGW
jgi:hypothetical protein